MVALVACLALVQTGTWTRIFNGKDLTGWSPKIKGYDFGVNFGDTFRVEKGVLKVSYDQYGGKFNDRFGHLFYKKPLHSYRLRFEYRFTGEQMPDGASWAWRNSGIMLHCQDPKTMRKDQDFPVSVEAQLLGGPETGERPTGSVCTPGTNIVIDGKLITQHCTDSTSLTMRGDQWVNFEVEVYGNDKIVHRVNGKEVMAYEQVQYDPRDPDGKSLIRNGALMIGSGYVSLQSESHPVEFRNIELQELPD